MDVMEAQEAKRLRDENTQLRQLVTDLKLHCIWPMGQDAMPVYPLFVDLHQQARHRLPTALAFYSRFLRWLH